MSIDIKELKHGQIICGSPKDNIQISTGLEVKLAEQLYECVKELQWLIDKENQRLKYQICGTDIDPPDYLDHETVYNSFKLLGESGFLCNNEQEGEQ